MDTLQLYFYIGMLCLYTVTAIDFNPGAKHTYSACFGSVSEVYLKASCPDGSFIAPFKVFSGAKQKSTGCIQEVSSNLSKTEEIRCCHPELNKDCITLYRNIDTPAETYVYHKGCAELRQCVGLQNARMAVANMNCTNSTTFLSNSNYLFMDYFCINEQTVGKLPKCSLETSAGEMLHIMGQQHLKEINVLEGHCQINTNPGSTIMVWLNDLNFHNKSTQKILIVNSDNSSHEINCSSSTRFSYTQIYNSTNDSIKLEFNNHANLGGHFWIAFKALGSDYLKVTCENIYNYQKIQPLPLSIRTPSLSPEKAKSTMIVAVAAGSSLAVVFVAVVLFLVFRYRSRVRKTSQTVNT